MVLPDNSLHTYCGPFNRLVDIIIAICCYVLCFDFCFQLPLNRNFDWAKQFRSGIFLIIRSVLYRRLVLPLKYSSFMNLWFYQYFENVNLKYWKLVLNLFSYTNVVIQSQELFYDGDFIENSDFINKTQTRIVNSSHSQ